MDAPVENRAFAYVRTGANLTSQIKESAAEGLFKSFHLLVGKNVRENSVRFEALLGVYTNAIEFVKFLETSLAISCLNTEFKDLRRMVEGKIQFKVSVPTIAHGDGRRPSKQRQYLVMKSAHKHHISAEIELSTEDIELLFAEKETQLDVAEYVGAVKTITSALQFGIDALERGLINVVLTSKLRQAPPTFILQSINDPSTAQRGFGKAAKSDIVANFKKHLLDHTFFLDDGLRSQRGRDYVLAVLADAVTAVNSESVFKGADFYTTEGGEPVSGVFETTDGTMQKLLNLVGQATSSILAPAAYANYVIRGGNVVTAMSYGKVMKNFDSFLSRMIESGTNKAVTENDFYTENGDTDMDVSKTMIPASTIRIGEKVFAIESLQRMYRETQQAYPLVRTMQYTYYFPVGLYLPDPKYTTSGTLRGLEGGAPPLEAWIVNKNNLIQCFTFDNALKMICHPRFHNPQLCLQNLPGEEFQQDHVLGYGIQSRQIGHMNLYRMMYGYYDGKAIAHIPDVVAKSELSTSEMLSPPMAHLLRLELHPVFDFYKIRGPNGAIECRATHRTHVGNIPEAFAPHKFQEGRGQQLESAAGLSHVIDQQTMELVQETAFDANYPPMCYVIEAMIHGQEDKFIMTSSIVALTITTYWNNTGHLAFVNSYFMIKYICKHFANGLIPREIYLLYKKIMAELVTMEQTLLKICGHEKVANVAVGQYFNSIMDPALLPPFINDDVLSKTLKNNHRKVSFYIGDELYDDQERKNVYIKEIETLENSYPAFDDIYTDMQDADHDDRKLLLLGPEPAGDLILEKLFYYVFLPVCTNGHVCGMGVDYEHVIQTLGFNGPVCLPTVNGRDDVFQHLANGPLKDLLIASDLRPTVGMIRLMVACSLTTPAVTQLVRVEAERDSVQQLATHESGTKVRHSVLVNGIAAFVVADRNKHVTETMFYPVPFHKFYADPVVAATLHPLVNNYLNNIPSQRNGICFNVPSEFMAEYEEWHKSPMLKYVRDCDVQPQSLSTMLAMHMKLSPMGFIHMTKLKVHPGVAMTVVRTDELLTENILYSNRASTSVFIGRPAVKRREIRADAVGFDVSNEIASLDTAMGYSSTLIPARVAGITTDMGIHCQDLFKMYPTDNYRNRELSTFIKNKIGSERAANGHGVDPLAYMAESRHGSEMCGLAHGQLATCEVILTPVTADLTYFQSPNSPRGRTGCVVSCDTYSPDNAVKLLYDHSQPDPAYEFRTTNNPWASQVGSLGDALYNNHNRQLVTPGLYSPCRQFFNKDMLLKNNKSLFTLIHEYISRLGGSPATSNTDVQFVVINGTDVFLEQPCMLLQEAYPTLSSSHKGLLDEFMSNKKGHAPVHNMHYLLEEVAPLKRVLKIGNKTA
ncbi:major capsid protein [Wood mouse herpesvirus]|uniref:Major capsid protein n=1 Tax=Wood mouse herpesvirus TaxID=432370 RepID=D0U1L5_9GAMA|nr:major capsid protein [Wood mouse herpesvirus]ACY41099.1 major capsid protein [Wood mouse herpesvirus]